MRERTAEDNRQPQKYANDLDASVSARTPDLERTRDETASEPR